jgi:transcriptional regulator of acetoin/glycerol metabolism
MIAQPIPLLREASQAPIASNDNEVNTPFLLDAVVKKTLMRSLHETEGNRMDAARLLGISRSTLYRMLKRYQLPPTHKQAM